LWGQGLAPEGAKRVVWLAFEKKLKLSGIGSFPAIHNIQLRRVMEKIGMCSDADEDLDHPGITPGFKLVRHCL